MSRTGRPSVHGHAKKGGSLTYKTWFSMKHRCYSKHNASYKYYGGKGVTVCDRWHSFENFLLDMGERPGLNFHISRKQDKGNYEPGNCEWKPSKDNLSERVYEVGEKVHNAKLTKDKVKHLRRLSNEGASLTELAKFFKVNRKTVWSVVNYETWKHVN